MPTLMPTPPQTQRTLPPIERLPPMHVSEEDRRIRGPEIDEASPDADGPHPLVLRARRELIVYGIALLCGLLLMPFLIWYAGNRWLGPYTHGQNPHGGPFALLQDY